MKWKIFILGRLRKKLKLLLIKICAFSFKSTHPTGFSLRGVFFFITWRGACNLLDIDFYVFAIFFVNDFNDLPIGT